MSAHDLVRTGECFVGHVTAAVAGSFLMILGLGLGVTMVTLPIGLVVGIVGALVFVWGMFGHLQGRARRRRRLNEQASERSLASWLGMPLRHLSK